MQNVPTVDAATASRIRGEWDKVKTAVEGRNLRDVNDPLGEDGMVVVNVITAAEGPKTCLLRQFYHSLKRIFPKVNAYRANPTIDPKAMQNVVIIAERGKLAQREIPNDSVVETLLQQELKTELPPPPFFFTDDFAPSEHAMNFGC